MPNGNDRGSNTDRRRRKLWLLEVYRANVDVVVRPVVKVSGDWDVLDPVPLGQGERACRCYCCGTLLNYARMTVDRIIPGCQGGTYRRNNIRPACLSCNSSTGAVIRRIPRKKRRPLNDDPRSMLDARG